MDNSQEMLEPPVLDPETLQYMWEQGRLKAKLQPKQKDVYDAIKRAIPEEPFPVICSRGFGKTFIGACIGTEAGLDPEPGNILILSSSLKQLRLILLPTWQQVLSDCPPHLMPRFKAQDSYWEFRNGVRAHLLAAQKGSIEKARGIHRVKLVLIEEAGFFGDEEDTYPLDQVIKNILIPMFIRTKSTPRIIFLSTPPETPNHPLKQIFQQAALSGSCATFDIYHSDIPHAKIEEIKRRMLAMPGGQLSWDREMLCKWVVDSNRLIIPEWDDKFIENARRTELFQYYDKYFSLDIGSVDKTVGHLSWYDFTNAVLHFEDEIVFEGRGWTTDNLAAELRAKEFGHWGEGYKVYKRTGDSDNQILLSDLTLLHKLAISPTTKDSLNAMVNKARMWVKNGRVRVNPRCKLLIETLRDGIWNKSKDEFARTTPLGHMDALASFIYNIRNIDDQHNPIPVHYGFDPATQIYTNQPKSQTTQNMERAMMASNPFIGGFGGAE